jgi:uncharacterized membrane protein
LLVDLASRTFLVIVLLALGLRCAGLTFDTLWLDEGYQTIVESYGNPLPDLLNAKAQPFLYKPSKPANIDTVLANFRKVDPLCPPLYALAMNRWLTVFGGSDLALRSLSLTFSCLTVIALYLFGNLIFGAPVGMFAALLAAVSPFDIAYAQEARTYSLLILEAMLSGGSLVLFLTRPQNYTTAFWAGLYIIATWALISSHYTGLFILAFEIAAGVVYSLWRRDWLLLAWVVVANLLIGLLFLPWYPLFHEAASIRTASFYVSREPSWWWPPYALFTRIPFNWIAFLAGKKVMVFAFPLYITSALFIIFGMMAAKMKATSKQAWIFVLAWCLAPALILWGLDVLESHRVIEIPRYIIGTAPAVYLLAGLGLFWMQKNLRKIFVPLLVVHCLFALANNAYAHIVHQRENWQEMAQLIQTKCKADDVIFVSQYYDIVCLDRYLTRPFKQVGVSPNMGKDQFEKVLGDLNLSEFWMLTAQEGDGIFAMIPARYYSIEDHDLGHALHLKHFVRH